MVSGQVRLSIFCGFRVGVVDVREADKRQSKDGNVHLVRACQAGVHVGQVGSGGGVSQQPPT